MKALLSRLYEMESLSRDEAYTLMQEIGSGRLSDAQLASLLTVWLMRPVSLPELEGFSASLLDLSTPFRTDFPVLDLCGTGGDGKNTFNISTLISFVLAALGYKVAKHGNYGVSSVSGSSTVMEYFGYRFSNDPDTLLRQLDETNICFLHAPLFHPALRHVGNVRRQLGVKTIFNMLGPLVNPARPRYRLSGVFSLELGRMYNYLLQDTMSEYMVVHSLDGYDEISLTGRVKLFTRKNEEIVTPEELGLPTLSEQDIFGGTTVDEAASVFINVLEGKGSNAQNAVVIANAAAAIRCVDPELAISEANERAREALLSGNAFRTFKALLQ